METVEGEEVLLEVDEDRAETRALELDTEAGLWTARERFYIGDTEHMACVASDRRADKQVGFWLRQELNESQSLFVRPVQTCLELSIFSLRYLLGLSQVTLRDLSQVSLSSLP